MSVSPDVPAKRSRTPIVLILVGVGCIGFLFIGAIIAAIAIPNFVSAREKARRHQSLFVMRSIGEGLESYHRQNGRYPAANSIAEVAAMLQPAHATSLKTSDSWGHELRYLCWPASRQGCDHYTLASAGKDGLFERQDLSAYEGEQTPWGEYNRDIVMLDGSFLQYPGSN